MYWKALVVVIFILVAAGAGSYVAYQYYYTQASEPYKGLTWFNYEGPVPEQTNQAATSSQTTPAGIATITEISTTSVAVLDNATNKTKTYAITKDTQVYSLVSIGQAGRPFSELKPGVRVKLAPLKSDPTTLYWIAFARDPALEPTADEVKHPLLGKVTAISADSITIASTSPVVVSITPATKVLVTVTAGEVAKPAVVQKTSAVVWGTPTSERTTTARVVIFTPLLTPQ